MNQNNILIETTRLSERVLPLERIVEILSAGLSFPTMLSDKHGRGFRYNKPDVRHFCLLRMCRIVSALNAAVQLAKLGYTQEIIVLLRTMIEHCSHVNFALFSLDASNKNYGKSGSLVRSFFADDGKADPGDKKPFRLRQEDIHKAIGQSLDDVVSAEADTTSILLSKVYISLSKYVHGGYKESMDLYGGIPGRFHLQGMSGTPKDQENIEILDTYITTASQCFVEVIHKLQLVTEVSKDSFLRDWYNSYVG